VACATCVGSIGHMKKRLDPHRAGLQEAARSSQELYRRIVVVVPHSFKRGWNESSPIERLRLIRTHPSDPSDSSYELRASETWSALGFLLVREFDGRRSARLILRETCRVPSSESDRVLDIFPGTKSRCRRAMVSSGREPSAPSPDRLRSPGLADRLLYIVRCSWATSARLFLLVI
jgi:hypothetical protein